MSDWSPIPVRRSRIVPELRLIFALAALVGITIIMAGTVMRMAGLALHAHQRAVVVQQDYCGNKCLVGTYCDEITATCLPHGFYHWGDPLPK